MMKLLYCQLAVVLLLPLALAGAAADEQFDFFFHVQLWPASHCAGDVDCCYVQFKPLGDFVIRGLRPYYASCRPRSFAPGEGPDEVCSPVFCHLNNSLNSSQIRDLRMELHHNWWSLSCEDNMGDIDLWDEAWTEHGTCSNMDQHSYFFAALDFKARFNLTRILLNAGIVPSNERMYELSRIRDTVTEATGSAPAVECNQNEQGEMQLYQVYQCIGLDGRSPVHCPRLPEEVETTYTTCTDMVKFPVFQTDD